MGLDRGNLARLDRKLLAEFGRDERFQMVRVPVTPAKWSTWKRYCESAGISMGRAIAALIEHELTDALDNSGGDAGSVFAHQAEERMAEREARLSRREDQLTAVEEGLRRGSQQLREREGQLEARERRLERATKLAALPSTNRSKTGRNERCPCGSGLKYKHCHGRSRQP